MRVVWPDQDTMPKKRKNSADALDPSADTGDSPAEESPAPSPEGTAAMPPLHLAPDDTELQDGAIAPEEPALDESDDLDDAEDSDESAAAEIDQGILEALLFSTHHPLTPQRLAELLETRSTKAIKNAVHQLNTHYDQTGRAFRVEQVAGGYQLLTLPEYGEHLKRMRQKDVDAKLTKAALETLAIIAYKQPILRADIEAIRGVACGETIRSLMEKHLVKIAGRAEEPGRPILYGTTKRFLELFGLNTTKDLPQSEDVVLPPLGGKPVSNGGAESAAATPAPEAPAAPSPDESAPKNGEMPPP